MKQQFTLIIFLSTLSTALAQFAEVSYGPGYTQQGFYRLSDNQTEFVDHTSWDLAFTALGLQDAGIHLNEAASSNGTQIELYALPNTTFGSVVDTTQLGNRLYNDEKSWTFGALNEGRNPQNPFDYGWGIYSPESNTITGTKSYALKLRNGNWIQFQIASLNVSTYNLRYAELDGSNVQTAQIDKSAFPDTPLVYFSFETGATLDPYPTDWDLMFTRYVTPLDDGQGNLLDYLVTGVLLAPGVEAVEVAGVNPQDVAFEDHQNSLSTDLDAIGHEWKSFNITTFQWSIPDDLVYFVRTEEQRVWRLAFIDFEGSSTGNAVFEKADLGVISSLDGPAAFEQVKAYPNPTRGDVSLAFSLETAGEVEIHLRDAMGRELWTEQRFRSSGLHTLSLPSIRGAAGVYFLELSKDGQRTTTKLLKQ